MQRAIATRPWLAAVVLGIVAGGPGRPCAAAERVPASRGSCTSDHGSGHVVRHGHVRDRAPACAPQGCGPVCHGHHGHRCCHAGACGPGACGHGGCCHGLCEQIGHCLHHDVYEKRYFLRGQGKSWHSAWYDPAEGRPLALVVPPTAEFQAQYGWGVPSSRVAPIYHQFRRPYPGPGAVGGAGGGFLPTPNQPSDTVQFGVNAVRGPWGAY